jgi:hypothetical protein
MRGDVSWIEVRLSEAADGRIRLELEHVAHVDDELWSQFGPGAVGIGWDLLLMGMARHLSGDEPMDPEQSAAWMASYEGGQFMALSNELWCLASIAAGTPAADAEAAAARTIAVYTGSEPAPES